MRLMQTIFDSDYHQWNKSSFEFIKKINGIEPLAFIIEGNDAFSFAIVVDNKIEGSFEATENGLKWTQTTKPKATVFPIEGNGRIRAPPGNVYEPPHHSHPIIIHDSDNDNLFTIGNDIVIVMKEECKDNSLFTREGPMVKHYKQPTIRRDSEEKTFSVKRIQVWQMKDTNERQQLVKYRKLIEEFTGMERGQLLADSDMQRHWEEASNYFYEFMQSKNPFVILIEDTERNVFGAYIDRKNKDENDFIFSFESNGRLSNPMKFPFKKEENNYSYKGYEEKESVLFSVGKGHDIHIMKKNQKNKCYCKQESFDYGELTNVLVGKEGKENPFTMKRIQVWEMIEKK